MIPRILVVDDDLETRELIEARLLGLGYEEVVLAEDASVAMRLLVGQIFDLLMTDQEMPGMPGDAFIRCVRQEFKLTLPIIFMTSSTDCRLPEVAKDAGANAFLSKPFEQMELQKAIKRVCGGAH